MDKLTQFASQSGFRTPSRTLCCGVWKKILLSVMLLLLVTKRDRLHQENVFPNVMKALVLPWSIRISTFPSSCGPIFFSLSLSIHYTVDIALPNELVMIWMMGVRPKHKRMAGTCERIHNVSGQHRSISEAEKLVTRYQEADAGECRFFDKRWKGKWWHCLRVLSQGLLPGLERVPPSLTVFHKFLDAPPRLGWSALNLGLETLRRHHIVDPRSPIGIDSGAACDIRIGVTGPARFPCPLIKKA
jgi:hypothetical protein